VHVHPGGSIERPQCKGYSADSNSFCDIHLHSTMFIISIASRGILHIPPYNISDSRLLAEQVRVPFPLSVFSFQNLQHFNGWFKPHLLSALISFHSCHPNTRSIPRRQIKVSKNGMYGGLIFRMYYSQLHTVEKTTKRRHSICFY